MPVSLIAPDPDHYQVGKGIVSFKPKGAASFIDLGNVIELEYEPNIEKLDHFSSRTGIKTKDKSIVLERGGTLRVLMDELTAQNLSMVLMGEIDDTPVDGTEIDIFTKDAQSGEVKFQATNDVGPRWDLHFYNVEFAPSGSFNPISEEWNEVEVTGEVLLAPAGHAKAGKTGLAKCTNVSPLPVISAVTPATGAAAGGDTVTITGAKLTGATDVTFDGVAATAVTVVSDTEVTCTTPAHAAGAVDVALTTPAGTTIKAAAFTYA